MIGYEITNDKHFINLVQNSSFIMKVFLLRTGALSQ